MTQWYMIRYEKWSVHDGSWSANEQRVSNGLTFRDEIMGPYFFKNRRIKKIERLDYTP